jgi:hypothetical protein
MKKNDQDKQEPPSGDRGKDGNKIGKYVQIYKRVKQDLGGIVPLLLAVLGTILLVFSPEKGWQFDIPSFIPSLYGYTLAYRGWLGCLCFFTVLVVLLIKTLKNRGKPPSSTQKMSVSTPAKGKTSATEQTSTDASSSAPEYVPPYSLKSMYVHFPWSRYDKLAEMTHQLARSKDYAAATLLLVTFQQNFEGKLYCSYSPQPFAVENADNLSSTQGEGKNRWCWWRWEGGKEGFQLLVSLCQW